MSVRRSTALDTTVSSGSSCERLFHFMQNDFAAMRRSRSIHGSTCDDGEAHKRRLCTNRAYSYVELSALSVADKIIEAERVSNMLPAPYRPIVILLFAISIITSSYVAAFRSGVLECPGLGTLVTPAISLLMFDGPGRLYGQFGFPVIALLFATCALPLRRGLVIALADEKPAPPSSAWLMGSASVAFLGLALVGAIPLQRDVCEVMGGRARLSYASIVHQIAAAIFFAGSALHMGLWLMLATTVSRECIISRASRPLSFFFKGACFVLSWLPLPAAFALHPASPVRTRLNLSEADAGGIQQYALVLCVASFFASYALELGAMERLQAHAAAKRKRR